MLFKRLIVTLFIIFIFISNFVYTASYADDEDPDSTKFDHYFSVPANTWNSGNKKVQVTTGINAANLTLPNGLELVHISSDIDDNTETISVTDPIQIICSVDISESMASDEINNSRGGAYAKYNLLISAMKKFTDLLFENMSDLKLDLIEFSTYAKLITSDCTDKDEFLKHFESDEDMAINNIFSAMLDHYGYGSSNSKSEQIYQEYENTFWGSTCIGTSLTIVDQRINEISASDPDRKIYVINLTDGYNTDQNDAANRKSSPKR